MINIYPYIFIGCFIISLAALFYQIYLAHIGKNRTKNDKFLRKYGTLVKTPEVKAVMAFENYNIEPGSYGPFKLGMTQDEFSKAMPSRVEYRNAPDDIAIGDDELIGYLMDYDVGPKFLFSADRSGNFTLNQITSQRYIPKGKLFAQKGLKLDRLDTNIDGLTYYINVNKAATASVIYKMWNDNIVQTTTLEYNLAQAQLKKYEE